MYNESFYTFVYKGAQQHFYSLYSPCGILKLVVKEFIID